MNEIKEILLYLAIFIVAGSIHELAHALSAWWLGDPTARDEGRITLNPLRHVDPVGTIIFPIVLTLTAGIGFGWMKPVPVLPYNLRKPDRDMAIIAFAGPFSNLIQGLLAILVLRVFSITDPDLHKVIGIYAVMNFILMGFNLLPVFPLDGDKVIRIFLPERWREKFDQYAHFGFLVFAVILISGVTKYWIRPFIKLMQFIASLDLGIIVGIAAASFVPVLLLFFKRETKKGFRKKVERITEIPEEAGLIKENARKASFVKKVRDAAEKGLVLPDKDQREFSDLRGAKINEAAAVCPPVDFDMDDRYCLSCAQYPGCLARELHQGKETE